jgi:hypothetical protein
MGPTLGRAWFFGAFLLAGCYGGAPPAPPEVAVSVVPGEEVEVRARREDTTERVEQKSHTCPQGHSPGSPACVVTTYYERVPVTYYYAKANYAGRTLTLAELDALTDPEWKTRIDKLNEYRAVCKQANVPRFVGLGLLIAGGVAVGIGGSRSDTGLGKGLIFGGIGGVGVGLGSYALGYFSFGGKRCNQARAIYDSLPSARDKEAFGIEQVEEMKNAADRFNAQQK